MSKLHDESVVIDGLIIAKWDHHTTARGHRLLADKLYERLVPLLFGSSP